VSFDTGVALSADGAHFAFASFAKGVVPEDRDNRTDVFVRDVATGTTRRVSVTTTGEQANGDSEDPAISADGRYVAFTSSASTLAPGDTNGLDDVYVRDRTGGTTERVSVGAAGELPNRGEGQFAGLGSRLASISADGSRVAFGSTGSNLVPGDTNQAEDIFVRDRIQQTTRRVSVSSSGAQLAAASFGPSFLDPGGQVILFATAANAIEPGAGTDARSVIHDDRTGKTAFAVPAPGARGVEDPTVDPVFSPDGRWMAFTTLASGLVPRDTNHRTDVFVRGPVTPPFTVPGTAP
jgi:Tol biopolymer transport system component